MRDGLPRSDSLMFLCQLDYQAGSMTRTGEKSLHLHSSSVRLIHPVRGAMHMGEQSPAVVYEFCCSIIDIGGQQFVFNTRTSNYSLPGKSKRRCRDLWDLRYYSLGVSVAWRFLHLDPGECLGDMVTTFKRIYKIHPFLLLCFFFHLI